jgi:hypothetical protein
MGLGEALVTPTVVGITTGTHRNADCPLKKTPIKHNKYAVNQKLKHFDDIRVVIGRIGVVFYKIRYVPS